LKLESVRLDDADTWLQLLSELPTILTSLRYLSVNYLFGGSTNKVWKRIVFPRLTGYLALPGSEDMEFKLNTARLTIGRPLQPSDVVGVTYSGQEMGKLWTMLSELVKYLKLMCEGRDSTSNEMASFFNNIANFRVTPRQMLVILLVSIERSRAYC
jgi:hypothetical protein